MRREKAWVLPKGKLQPREHPRDAAKREVLEETGHDVSVHKFLGSMAYPALGRIKIVQFWLMRASALPERELSSDVKAVKWLPLKQAIDLLSRPHEKVFLTHVGPIALDEIKKATHRKTRVSRGGVSKRRPSSAPAMAIPHLIAMDYQRTRPSAFAKALGRWFGNRRAG
jgi:8-oxo-dGTP diphosphatase